MQKLAREKTSSEIGGTRNPNTGEMSSTDGRYKQLLKPMLPNGTLERKFELNPLKETNFGVVAISGLQITVGHRTITDQNLPRSD